jgi:hypothetical protein
MKLKKISELLIALGLCPAYKGYTYLQYAVYLTTTQKYRQGLIVGELYQETAEHFHVSKSTVQHSIRSLLDVYWNQDNTQHFSNITGFPIHNNSTLPPREFIAIVSEYLLQTCDIPYWEL